MIASGDFNATHDHVVTRGVDAADTRTVDLPGSDHRGLLATLRVRSS